MSSTVQPMPARATAARSMPFVFAPVDAMTLPLAFRPACSIRGQAMRFGRPPTMAVGPGRIERSRMGFGVLPASPAGAAHDDERKQR